MRSLEELNIAGDNLKHIEFAEGLTRIKQVILHDNNLKEVNIPEETLNALESLTVAGDPLTDAMRYSLQQLHNRFPNLEITGNSSSERRVINEQMLQKHVDTLVPYSLQQIL